MNQDRQTGVRGLAKSPNCAGCPCARAGLPYRPVRAFGSPGGLCIVSESPGSEETMQGFPLVGAPGKVVIKALRLAGIDRGYVWVVKALLCKRPASDEDMAIAIEHCRPRLEADLRMGAPTAICALGGTVMRALHLPVTFVAQARGTVQESPMLPGVPVIGTVSPAALLRGGAGEMGGGNKQKMNVEAQAMFLFSDIEKTHKISTGEVSPTWSDDILVVHEASEVEAALTGILADIYAWGCLGLDLEWFCVDSKNALDALGAGAHRAQITWVGIGCEKRSVSFSWNALIESGAWPMLQAAMEDPNLAKLSHNKQADKAVWEAQVGPIKGQYLDTMLLHHAVCPGIDHDLQQVVSQYLCVPPWKVDHAKRRKECEAAQKEAEKAQRAVEKEVEKAANKAEHDAANAAKKAEAEVRKAQRKAEHEARNAASKADKESRKGKRKKKDAAPAVDPRQLEFAATLQQGVPPECESLDGVCPDDSDLPF